MISSTTSDQSVWLCRRRLEVNYCDLLGYPENIRRRRKRYVVWNTVFFIGYITLVILTFWFVRLDRERNTLRTAFRWILDLGLPSLYVHRVALPRLLHQVILERSFTAVIWVKAISRNAGQQLVLMRLHSWDYEFALSVHDRHACVCVRCSTEVFRYCLEHVIFLKKIIIIIIIFDFPGECIIYRVSEWNKIRNVVM